MSTSYGTVKVKVKSGSSYVFNAYPITEECPDEGGIYIFAKREITFSHPTGYYGVIYIGKAQSFQSRFYNHHKEECIKKNGGNCILLLNVPTETQRDTIEKELLAVFDTPCNEKNN